MTQENSHVHDGDSRGSPPECITCSDQLLRMLVESVDDTGMLASGSIDGEPAEIGIELIDGVHPGDILLCHGGVALQRVDAAMGIEVRL